MKLNELLLEKLAPSIYRQYVKNWDKTRYADIFNKYPHDRNAYRIYIPILSNDNIQPDPRVLNYIKQYGYEVYDYRSGYVQKPGTQPEKIGSVLKDQTIKRIYDKDPARRESKHIIVISRHPYDIAGMSTDRGWKSCMNLDIATNQAHIFSQYIPIDIKEGTLIAYLVKKEDTNIERPSARILIKPFIKIDNEREVMLGVEDKVYGTAPAEFKNTVVKWANEVNASKGLYGAFVFNDKLYDDFIENPETKKADSDKYYKVVAKDDNERKQIEQVKEDYTTILDIENPSVAIRMAALYNPSGFKFLVLNQIPVTEEMKLFAIKLHDKKIVDNITLMYRYKIPPTSKTLVAALSKQHKVLPILEANNVKLDKNDVDKVIKKNNLMLGHFIENGYTDFVSKTVDNAIRHYSQLLPDALEIGIIPSKETILFSLRKDPSLIEILPSFGIKVTKEMKEVAAQAKKDLDIDWADFMSN
jgi:hypothetical protein